jgi:phage/plasmid primase-like uncharacterized protein
MIPGFRRVTSRDRCLICGKGDWCLKSDDNGRAICPRVASDRQWGEAGWLHTIHSDVVVRPVIRRQPKPIDRPVVDWTEVSDRCREACNFDMVAALANSLRVSWSSLTALHVGWDKSKQCWTFPMRDARGRVCGIRTREQDGQKRAISGSESGLFFMPVQPELVPATVYVCEGPTDAAALITVGLYPIGRPSCNSGNAKLVEWLWRSRRHVVFIVDRDKAGVEGAQKCAHEVHKPARSVRLMHPLKGKDIREWVGQGASRALIESVAATASYVRSPA